MVQAQGAFASTRLFILLVLVALDARGIRAAPYRVQRSAVLVGDGHQTPLPDLLQAPQGNPTVMDSQTMKKETLREGNRQAASVSVDNPGAIRSTAVIGVESQKNSKAVNVVVDFWKYCIGGAVVIVVSMLLGMLWWGLMCLRRKRRRMLQAALAAQKDSILLEAVRKQPADLRAFIARYSYDPFQGPNEHPELELPLVAGQYVYVVGDMDEDGWYVGELTDGTRGFVPSNFVEEVCIEEPPVDIRISPETWV